jgi:hypothetical protein
VARSEARITVDIWDDDDFLALTGDAQRVFMFLLSQRDMAHTGVIALRVKRWARRARDLTPEVVTAALGELVAGRFVVIDEDTEELLVRSFMRRDKVYRQPNVLCAARDHLPLIESRPILSELAVELRRIAEAGDMTQRSAAIVAEMLQAIGDGYPDPPSNRQDNRQDNRSGNPSGKGSDVPSGKGTRGAHGERGRVRSSSSDSPIPDSPNPGGTAAYVANGSRGRDLGEPPNSDPAGPAERIITGWLSSLPNGRAQPAVVDAIARHVHDALRVGTTETDVAEALRLWQVRGDLGPGVLPSLIHQISTAVPDAEQPGTVVALRHQKRPDQRQSTTDSRVQGWLDLGAQLAAEGAT